MHRHKCTVKAHYKANTYVTITQIKKLNVACNLEGLTYPFLEASPLPFNYHDFYGNSDFSFILILLIFVFSEFIFVGSCTTT